MAFVYFHIDLNAFFANAEVLLDPSLKGKPLVVSGHSRRSVVSTASYEARAFGIHSAMPLSEARNRCKDLIVVEGHYSFYGELSNQFMKLISSYSDSIEQASIDECYVDMTEKIKEYERPLDLATEIQRRVLNEIGIPCSIGVAPNMFLAKMASDMKKPMGITVLRIRDVEEKMWPLPIGDMRGIGIRTVQLLEDLGIYTIKDLALYKNLEDLKPIFGKNLDEIMEKTRGIDHRAILKSYDSKSMGISETFLDDIIEYDELRGILRVLSKKLSKRLKNEKKKGKHVSIRICYYDFRNVDRSITIPEAIWKADDIFVQAISLFDENWDEGEAVRLLGISVSQFTEGDDDEFTLFNQEEYLKTETNSILEDLNKQLGKKGFIRASKLMKD